MFTDHWPEESKCTFRVTLREVRWLRISRQPSTCRAGDLLKLEITFAHFYCVREAACNIHNKSQAVCLVYVCMWVIVEWSACRAHTHGANGVWDRHNSKLQFGLQNTMVMAKGNGSPNTEGRTLTVVLPRVCASRRPFCVPDRPGSSASSVSPAWYHPSWWLAWHLE